MRPSNASVICIIIAGWVTGSAARRLLLQVSLTRPECGVGWGMSLVDDTEQEVRQRGGVPVSAVAPGGPADAAGVAAGDVISHVAGRKVWAQPAQPNRR